MEQIPKIFLCYNKGIYEGHFYFAVARRVGVSALYLRW